MHKEGNDISAIFSPKELTPSKLTDGSYTSAYDFRAGDNPIVFPKEVSGLRILDIGSGGSNAFALLRERGAIVVSLDPRYKNISSIKAHLDEYLEDKLDYAPELKQEGLNEGEIWLKKYELEVNKRRAVGAFDEFIGGVKSGEGHNVAGVSESLPFPNGSFDFVFSHDCISRIHVMNVEMFIQAVQEGLRVLKPGGEFQIGPWDAHRPAKYFEGEAVKALQKYLDKRHIQHRFEQQSTIDNSSRLCIFKPEAQKRHFFDLFKR